MNVSQSSIDAIFITAVHTGAGGKFLSRDDHWFDGALHGAFWRPLQSGESRSFKAMPDSLEERTEFAVRAVAFADGTTQGEPEWVEILMTARQAAHEYLGLILQRLSHAVTAVPTREVLLKEIRQLEDEMTREVDFQHDLLPKPQEMAITQVFGMVIGDLGGQRQMTDTQSWPEQIRAAEYRCRSMQRDLEATQPPLPNK